MTNLELALAIAAAAVVGVAHAAAPTLSDESFKPAVEKYLQEKGDFCLGKFNWPIIVTDAERQSGTNDALQMPVLERLGLVVSSPNVSDPATREYNLTTAGKKYYLVKQTVAFGPGNTMMNYRGDFCAAKLELDKVVGWQVPEIVNGRAQTTVQFTYKVAAAADWTRDPGIKQVFPMIPRILDSAGKMPMTQLFAWSNQKWVAVAPGS
jgi:hypothetical protein